VLEHAVTAARRLNDPVPECEKYVDEVLHFFPQQLVSGDFAPFKTAPVLEIER
jgi:hypothetical protein